MPEAGTLESGKVNVAFVCEKLSMTVTESDGPGFNASAENVKINYPNAKKEIVSAMEQWWGAGLIASTGAQVSITQPKATGASGNG